MTYRKYTYTLLLAFFIASTAFAQIDSNPGRYIDVTGSAELMVTPDIIKLSVTLREYEENKRLIDLKQIELGFLKAVKGSGLPEEMVAVTQVSSNAYNTKKKRKAFASKTYELTFRDHKGLLDFTSRLKNADIAYMHISQLHHTRMDELRLKVKKEALVAAKTKAKALVEAVNADLGPILTIHEGNNNYFWRSNYNSLSNTTMRMEQDTESLEADDIGFKKIKLRYEINARFGIE